MVVGSIVFSFLSMWTSLPLSATRVGDRRRRRAGSHTLHGAPVSRLSYTFRVPMCAAAERCPHGVAQPDAAMIDHDPAPFVTGSTQVSAGMEFSYSRRTQ